MPWKPSDGSCDCADAGTLVSSPPTPPRDAVAARAAPPPRNPRRDRRAATTSSKVGLEEGLQTSSSCFVAMDMSLPATRKAVAANGHRLIGSVERNPTGGV